MISIAIIGAGKIARDQHVPAIAGNGNFRLAAAVTLGPPLEGVPNFRSIADMKAVLPDVTAASICTPPRGRLELCRQAFDHGLDLMIEKPPAADMAEAAAIAAGADAAGRILFTAWHSREAAAIAPARDWLAERKIRSVHVTWKEDVRVWHPGQEWIWDTGVGVFDPGINAMSVVTLLLTPPLRLRRAALEYPRNCAGPVAAQLSYDCGGAPVTMDFDFDQRGPQTWDIDIATDSGLLKLSGGAAKMAVDGAAVAVEARSEYAALYRNFAERLKTGRSEVDFGPLALVEEALRLGQRKTAPEFHWQ